MSSDEAARYLERQRQTASNVVTAATANRRALREGEWACVDAKCAHINNERISSCERCGKGKPRSKNRVGREIGKDAAEKSKGLFAAEDWACTKCGNVNWARRTACNICNAPKLGDLEVRTGYGGGYMDRQNVEYIERKDEDEFDEFGRKKKRRKMDEDQYKERDENDANRSVRSENQEDEEEEVKERREGNNDDDLFIGDESVDEDDEEEENEADLGKYDLSADEIEVESLKEKIAARKAALALSTLSGTIRSGDSRCSSECTCSCSGGECSCEESDTEDDRRRSSRDRERDKDKNKGDNSSKDRFSHRDDRDRRDDRKHGQHRNQSRECSPRRHHSLVHRDRDRR